MWPWHHKDWHPAVDLPPPQHAPCNSAYPHTHTSTGQWHGHISQWAVIHDSLSCPLQNLPSNGPFAYQWWVSDITLHLLYSNPLPSHVTSKKGHKEAYLPVILKTITKHFSTFSLLNGSLFQSRQTPHSQSGNHLSRAGHSRRQGVNYTLRLCTG